MVLKLKREKLSFRNYTPYKYSCDFTEMDIMFCDKVKNTYSSFPVIHKIGIIDILV